MRRVTGVLVHPRATMAEVVRHPVFLTTWVVVLLAVVVCGGLLLSTQVGQQALVDERVRVTEALGGRVDDVEYARLEAAPPVSIYLTSGGRLLVTPPVTLLVAAGLILLARLDGVGLTYVTALAIVVHATVVLALQQIVATPLHYVAESLTSPTNLAGLLRMFDEERRAFIMDYDDPRIAFTGRITAKPLSSAEIKNALEAFQMFRGKLAFPGDYEERLKAAARQDLSSDESQLEVIATP